MKHNFRIDPSSDTAANFLVWLDNETVQSLQRDYGNLDATITSVFLFVNRAYESGLAENKIGELFERCVGRAGYTEEEREPLYSLFAQQSKIAKKIHATSQ